MNYKIKLPEIPLSHYSGNYEAWNMLKIEFNNIVINYEELSEAQKLYHFHSTLRNEAKLLETPDNIFDSWFKELKNTFENKGIIVNIYLKDVLNFERITHESSKELRCLLDVINKNIRALNNLINKNIRALNNLGFKRNSLSDILFTTIILEKLYKESGKQFELSIKISEVLSFDNLMDFLEKRKQLL